MDRKPSFGEANNEKWLIKGVAESGNVAVVPVQASGVKVKSGKATAIVQCGVDVTH